jgi:thioredoxin 2
VDRLDQGPCCGKCKAPLSTAELGRVVEVTDQTFDREVLGSGMPVLVDCWAPWCGPCRSVAPVMEALAGKWAGRVRVMKLNLDENPGIGARYRISSGPTMMLVKNGQIKDTLVGAHPQETLEAALERIL